MTSDVDTVVRLTRGKSGKFNFRLKHDAHYGLGSQNYLNVGNFDHLKGSATWMLVTDVEYSHRQHHCS